jgi:putative Ca2+/H+ antiporter (TMEM165/GDT1 family)
MMQAFVSSVLPVALAEIGDKTQLLTLFLAARFAKKYAIIAGMVVATLLNHVVSAWLGVELARWLTPSVMSWVVGASFIVVGLWLLKPDKDDEVSSRYLQYGAFTATLVLFFLAEIGDKTQISTILLAARYHDIFSVVTGSTVGLLIANVPVIFLGAWLMQRLPFKAIRIGACVLFCLLGLFTLLHVWG